MPFMGAAFKEVSIDWRPPMMARSPIPSRTPRPRSRNEMTMTRLIFSLSLVLVMLSPAFADPRRSYRAHGYRAHGHGHSRTYGYGRGYGYGSGYTLQQGYETYFGSPRPYPETICVPVKEATPDRYTFVHPDLGPEYLCRMLW
jgi:hypothetical protein